MIVPALRLAALLASAILAGALAGPPVRAQSRAPQVPTHAPCVAAVERCAAWIQPVAGPGRSMVYATYALDRPDPKIRHALIMVHGTLRNADHYFATAVAAGFLAGALDDTLIIAPAFHSAEPGCDDHLKADEISWSCHGDSWRSGGAASGRAGVTSFDLVDALVRRLADRRRFPNLSSIVIAGHSAGGQFVARYAMANRVHESVGVPIAYVIANPSSYAWPDATRPLAIGDADPARAATGWREESAHVHFSFGPFDATRTSDFDRWPYGLEGRVGGYTAGTGDDVLRRQLATRPITLLLSQVDTLPLGGFDDSSEAMAQGPTRRARGEAFAAYIHARLGASPRVMIVPECGHNDRCVYTTDAVLPVIFPGVAP